jgi:hypothetical protein
MKSTCRVFANKFERRSIASFTPPITGVQVPEHLYKHCLHPQQKPGQSMDHLQTALWFYQSQAPPHPTGTDVEAFSLAAQNASAPGKSYLTVMQLRLAPYTHCHCMEISRYTRIEMFGSNVHVLPHLVRNDNGKKIDLSARAYGFAQLPETSMFRRAWKACKKDALQLWDVSMYGLGSLRC